MTSRRTGLFLALIALILAAYSFTVIAHRGHAKPFHPGLFQGL